MATTQVKINFDTKIATVALAFNKVDGVWQCNLTDEFMTDLLQVVQGKVPVEQVKWVDIPNVGLDDV
jgi:hypothetical protein